jgi:predicted acyl esterase
LSAFEAIPSVTVLFDNGAGGGPTGQSAAGNPYPGFQQSFARFPIPGTVARRWYLGPNGTLSDRQAGAGVNVYTSDPKALPLTDFGPNTGGGGLWGNASQWQWNWRPNPAGTAVSYLTAPLAQNTTVIGAGSIDVWVRSSTPDVDLQATVSEVDPTGNETFVQNGWIRGSERTLSTTANDILRQASTPLEPVPSLLPSDVRPMPANRFVQVVIPLYFEGHAYRAGTRIRITISAPNGSQPVWSFSQPVPSGTSTVSIAFSRTMPSSLVLPVVPGVAIPTGLPACPSLRNEPCRGYHPMVNRLGTW